MLRTLPCLLQYYIYNLFSSILKQFCDSLYSPLFVFIHNFSVCYDQRKMVQHREKEVRCWTDQSYSTIGMLQNALEDEMWCPEAVGWASITTWFIATMDKTHCPKWWVQMSKAHQDISLSYQKVFNHWYRSRARRMIKGCHHPGQSLSSAPIRDGLPKPEDQHSETQEAIRLSDEDTLESLNIPTTHRHTHKTVCNKGKKLHTL